MGCWICQQSSWIWQFLKKSCVNNFFNKIPGEFGSGSAQDGGTAELTLKLKIIHNMIKYCFLHKQYHHEF